MNPCHCVYCGDPTKECTCSPSLMTKYQKRISGPLLDPLRVDIHIEVPRVPYEKLTGERLGESSAIVTARVEAARERQLSGQVLKTVSTRWRIRPIKA